MAKVHRRMSVSIIILTEHHLCYRNKYGLADYTFQIRIGSPYCFHRPATNDKKSISIHIVIGKDKKLTWTTTRP